MTTMYRISADGKTFSEQLYSHDEMRRMVDELADGKPWGWRPECHGSAVVEAVCDHLVILRAVLAD